MKRNNLVTLFHATRAHVLIEWLSNTRIIKPKLNQYKYKNIEPTKFDRELTKLNGVVYDIRDYLNDGKFQAEKRTIYEDIKYKRVIETTEKHQKTTTMLIPFMSNDTLSEIGFNASDLIRVTDYPEILLTVISSYISCLGFMELLSGACIRDSLTLLKTRGLEEAGIY